MAWPVTAGIYFVSDVMLALAFEPVLRLLAWLGGRPVSRPLQRGDEGCRPGFLMDWAVAIAGDMLYYAVIAITTLRLNKYFRDPDTTMRSARRNDRRPHDRSLFPGS